jgi:hypothetical protein
VLERFAAPRHDVVFLLEVGRARLLQIPLDAFGAALGDGEVGEQELVFHRLRILGRRG